MSREPMNLEGVELHSENGIWRIEYIGQPKRASDADRIIYDLRIKWTDPQNPNNKKTPERRLSLTIYPSDALNTGFEERLRTYLTDWVGFFGNVEAVFTFAEGLRDHRPE
jgi:hypothetical protein